MNDNRLQYIDSIASEYISDRDCSEKALALRNKLWVELFDEYGRSFTPDDINNSFLSCIKNWDGSGSFTKYFSFTINRRKKDIHRKTKSDTVSIYTDNDSDEELSLLDIERYATYDEYNVGGSASDYLSILTDAINTVNMVYRGRETINYAQLYFTETAAALREDGEISCEDISDIADEIMNVLNNDFLDFFKTHDCFTLDDIYRYSCRLLSEFSDKCDDPSLPCIFDEPARLYAEVFIKYIEKNDGKTVTVGNLSQQRKKYNELRSELAKQLK